MNTVQDILADKGSRVHTVSESASVLEAVGKMNDERIGSLVTTRADGAISGIVTEREVAACAINEAKLR